MLSVIVCWRNISPFRYDHRVSAYTGKMHSYTSTFSDLARHKQTGDPISIDDFSFVDTSFYNFAELLLRESLLISKFNLSLNESTLKLYMSL